MLFMYLGTTFNISAYPDEELSVTLIEGKLKVTAPSGEYYLLPGEHYSSAQSKVSKVDTEFYTSWTDGAMEFDAMPFPLLTARLSRCYNVDIQIASKELETMKFTGIIFRNKPLDFALDIIHRVSDVKFERKGETISERNAICGSDGKEYQTDAATGQSDIGFP